jgi:pimeloyl-ACP methyl ester carboxylesterase
MNNSNPRIIPLRLAQSDLPITLTDVGSGRVALVLHGGGGPVTVASIGAHLAETMRVITPTHPGWNGIERPAWLTSVGDIADAYLKLLDAGGMRDVLVVGSSMGGWIAAEMAVRDDAQRVSRVVLIDSAGVEIAGQPIRDFFALDPRGVAEYSYHDPDRFYIDPTTIPPERAALMRGNMATMRLLAGAMYDPTLLGRLKGIQVPALLLWGDSDRIFTPEYGLAFARAIPGSQYTMIANAGHLPHIEQPAATFATLDAFLAQG